MAMLWGLKRLMKKYGSVPETPQNTLPRIEGQYLRTAMSYWTNLNTMIWQKLVLVLTVQTVSIAASFQLRRTGISVVILAFALTLSALLVYAVGSDIKIRDEMKKQCNYLSSTLLQRHFREAAENNVVAAPPIFVLYDSRTNKREWFIRGRYAVWGVIAAIVLVDGTLLYIFNYASHEWLAHPPFPFSILHLPLLPITIPLNLPLTNHLFGRSGLA